MTTVTVDTKPLKRVSNFNVSNLLTMSRIALIPVIIPFFYSQSLLIQVIGLVLCGIACYTDYLDGWSARKWHLQTDFGKWLDPIADKLFVSSMFIMLSIRGDVPLLVTAIIIGREVLVTCFRIFVGCKYERTISVTNEAKKKTAFQMISILAFFVPITTAAPFVVFVLSRVIQWNAIAWAVWLTIKSGIDYYLEYDRICFEEYLKSV